jgi:hypothetical protein
MKSLLLGVALALATASNALAYKITASPTAGQELRYDHGESMVVSRQASSIVRVLPHANGPHGRMIFTVLAYNQGATPFNFGYENVGVSNGKGPVRLFTLEDIRKEAQKAANWQTFAVALAAGAQAYSAAQATTYSSSGSVYGYGGSASYYSSGSSYNPALTSIAESQIQGQAASNLQAISANLDSYMGTIGSRILQITTVDPNTASGGAVFADRPNYAKGEDRTVKVVVTVGGDTHEFFFAVND